MFPWLDPHLILATTGPWALVVCAVIVFAETGLLIGFFLPGDSLVFLLGMLTGAAQSQNEALSALPLWLVCLVIAVMAFAGDQTGYSIGRLSLRSERIARSVQGRLAPHSAKASHFFARFGGPAILLARFIPIIRTFVPFAAGVAGYGRTRFLFWNGIGALIWGIGLPVAGHLLGGIPWIADHVDVILILIVVLSVLPVAIRLAVGWLQSRRAAA
ncbi:MULTISPECIES: DedA family protein [unclassified Pseudoclavibacter]|uniref:DedA family protein n=1 Tax=unclassified Pseudoclavibacter TaxID=2615177 RepID=UPI001301837F|nr:MULTISPECIES: VTT domain-containing protein [unclassified Pseudoclavibacter]KAB1647505.1 DedA family protein [Pseudoclavibacter sp. CFCC 14310]KAB1663139.1 DedA family protein [Pseudoclavibacter sp. CFCC 13611]